MIFLCILCYQHLKITNIDCNLPNYHPSFDTNEPLNLQISCTSDHIQEIYLEKNPNIKLITISDESNVIISCLQTENEMEHVQLNIFGTPTISFNNSCHFSIIEINDSPKFKLLQNSSFFVDSLILPNREYQFPFSFKDVHYQQNAIEKNDQSKKPNDDSEKKINCDYNLELRMNKDFVSANCTHEDIILISYTSLHLYYFTTRNIFYIVKGNIADNDIYENMKLMANSIRDHYDNLIKFIGFYDFKKLPSYIDLFPNKYNILLDLPNEYSSWCNKSRILDVGDLDDLLKSDWSIDCYKPKLYLYFEPRENIYEIEFVSKKTYIALLVSIIIILILFLASLFLIVYYRFKKSKKDNSSENENEPTPEI